MSEVVSEPQIQLTDSARRKARNAERRRNARAARKAREAAERADEVQRLLAAGAPILQCPRCHEWKDQSKFATYKHAGKVYRHRKCGTCRSNRYLRSRCCKKKKQFIISLRSKPCTRCGHTFPPAAMRIMCTQGRPKFDLNLAWRGHSLASMLKESERYSTYCANCISVIRFDRRELHHPSTSKLAELPPELAEQVRAPSISELNARKKLQEPTGCPQ